MFCHFCQATSDRRCFDYVLVKGGGAKWFLLEEICGIFVWISVDMFDQTVFLYRFSSFDPTARKTFDWCNVSFVLTTHLTFQLYHFWVTYFFIQITVIAFLPPFNSCKISHDDTNRSTWSQCISCQFKASDQSPVSVLEVFHPGCLIRARNIAILDPFWVLFRRIYLNDEKTAKCQVSGPCEQFLSLYWVNYKLRC